MPMPPYRALSSSCKKTTLFFDSTGGSRWNHLPVQKALYFLFTKKNALERAFYNSFVYLSPFIYDLSTIQKEFCQEIFRTIQNQKSRALIGAILSIGRKFFYRFQRLTHHPAFLIRQILRAEIDRVLRLIHADKNMLIRAYDERRLPGARLRDMRKCARVTLSHRTMIHPIRAQKAVLPHRGKACAPRARPSLRSTPSSLSP